MNTNANAHHHEIQINEPVKSEAEFEYRTLPTRVGEKLRFKAVDRVAGLNLHLERARPLKETDLVVCSRGGTQEFRVPVGRVHSKAMLLNEEFARDDIMAVEVTRNRSRVEVEISLKSGMSISFYLSPKSVKRTSAKRARVRPRTGRNSRSGASRSLTRPTLRDRVVDTKSTARNEEYASKA